MIGHLPVVTSTKVSRGTCKFCGQDVYWVTVGRRGPGLPAKPWAFDSKPIPTKTDRNDETGLVIEWWPAGLSHFKTCKEMPDRTKQKKQKARWRQASINHQERLW